MRVTWIPSEPNKDLIERSKDHPLMEQMGTDLAKALQSNMRKKRYATFYAKIRKSERGGGS